MSGAAPRRVVVAVDSFKGSIGARDAASAVAAGWADVRPGDEVRVSPMADGGDGTLETLAMLPGAVRVPVTVTGPDHRPVPASWLLLPPAPGLPGGTAVVELAATSGLALTADRRPLDAHTRGFGEAVADALAHGVSRLVLTLGGSASTDGGTGMLTALGARFLGGDGRPIVAGGRGLADLAAVELAGLPPLPPGGALVLTDVDSPLLGERGAAAVFAPQKGASPAEIAMLDAGLARLAALTAGDPDVPGAGAAGGTGFALALWGARLTAGAPVIADLVGLTAMIAESDLVVTGEGAYDAQTSAGKAPAHVTALARACGVRVALVAGRIASGVDLGAFAASASLTELAGGSAPALAEPARWLRVAGARLATEVHPAE